MDKWDRSEHKSSIAYRTCLRDVSALAMCLTFAGACLGASATVTVGGLSAALGSAVASHKGDAEVSRRISALVLSERITEDALASLQNRAPGPRSAATLEQLMLQSAFLEPPQSDLPAIAKPSLEEQRGFFRRVQLYVDEFAKRLPNLICTESIVRFDDDTLRPVHGVRALGRLHALDSIQAQMTYSNGDESVSVKAVNGKPYSELKRLGVTTHGDFGNTLLGLVLPETKTRASWSHWELHHGKPVAVFKYGVALANSQYVVAFGCEGANDKAARVAYDGYISIEAESGVVLRITRVAEGLLETFPTHVAQTAIDYGQVNIGGQSYVVPIRSVSFSNNPASCSQPDKVRLESLNLTRYASYRLFQAESKLVADGHQTTTKGLRSLTRESEVNLAPLTEPLVDVATVPQPAPAANIEAAPDTGNESFFALPPAPAFHEADTVDTTFATHATFRERLNIVTVPVVVRDRAGEVVAKLTKDDFEISDNGKRQTISNFAEQDGSQRTEHAPVDSPDGSGKDAASDLAPDRFLAYMFDDVHLSFGDLSQTRAAAERVLDESLDPGTRIGIFTTSGRTTLEFSRDRNKIAAAMLMLRPAAAKHTDCPDVSYYMADQAVNKRDGTALAELTRQAIAECNIPIQSAPEMASEAARRSLQIHDLETRSALDSIRVIALRMAALPGERSMVLVSPGFFVEAGEPDMQEVLDRAARSGLMIHTMDARGLYTPGGFDASDSSSSSVDKIKYSQTEQKLDEDPLVQLADATGGRIFRNSNDFDAGFRRLSERPGVVYLLGFSPADGRASRSYHKLRVALRGRKGLEVQARRGYLSQERKSDTAKEAEEEIENALLSREEMREIPMQLQAATVKVIGGDRSLELITHVDPSGIQFQKQDGRNKIKLTITFGFFNGNGLLLSVQKQQLTLDFDDKDLQARLESGLGVKSALNLKPGSEFVRVVLRDAEGQMSTANEPLH